MKTSPINIVHQYAASVRDGSLPSCQMVRLAVERWYADWERDDLYFDTRAFNTFVRFCGLLKHFKGEFAGRPIILEPWQLFIAANIFGWKYKETKKRRYTYADVYVPRKNGKTTLAAVIALFLLIMDGEPAAEVYAAAVDKEQAKICFNASAELLRNSELSDYAKIFRKGSIVVEETASAYKPLSKDTKNKDGLNIHGAICDERHAWKTNEIMEVITTGTGARSQPLIFSISTAGTDTSYPYFDDLEAFREIMLGIHQKDNHFIMLYEPDEGDQWDDEATWRKVNPNYGVSLSKKYMKEECENARTRGGSTLANFKTKLLNMWVDAPEIWLPDELVAANNAPFDEAQLIGKDVNVGIDLAATGDITATALYFPQFKVFKYFFIVPEAKLQEDNGRGDIVDYRLWAEQGWLTVCPGPVLDQDWYVDFLLNALSPYNVKYIAYDPWNMWWVKQKLFKYENELVIYQQNMKYLYPPTKRMGEMIARKELNFLDNPIIRWMFRNVVLFTDINNNYRPSKGKSKKKIDGILASLNALAADMNSAENDKTIYASHGLRVISMEDSQDDGDDEKS